MPCSTRKLPRYLLVLFALGGAIFGGCGFGDEHSRPDAAPGAPNVIVITLDDATAEQVNPRTMPTAFAELAGRGTRFENFIAPSPLCCPSRAAFLTGQYGHNNHVLKNDYRRLGSKGNILPRWLQGAGYRTAHVGKYLNNFTAALDDPTDVPWGWDEWFTLLDNGYYAYDASDNGERVAFGSEPEDYVTRVLNRRALGFVERSAAAGESPFYLQIDHYAPHHHVASGPRDDCRGGATIDPDDYPSLRDAPFPESASTNEADVSDKPWFIREADRLSERELDRRKAHHRCASAALRPVDRGLRDMIEALRRNGALEKTAIFLTSDNGFFYGEHRIPAYKEFPYEENLRMPLLVRLPEAVVDERRVARVDAPTANIDLAPTILELAGGEPCEGDKCRLIDGRSLLPLIASPDVEWQDRALLVELDQSPSGKQSRQRPCSYIGVRAAGQLYVEHRTAAAAGTRCRSTDAVEHYDMRSDPAQLDNLAGSDRARSQRRALKRKLEELRDCEGNAAAGAELENPCE